MYTMYNASVYYDHRHHRIHRVYCVCIPCIMPQYIMTTATTVYTVLLRMHTMYNASIYYDHRHHRIHVFCGHEIDANGLHKTQEKIEAVVNAPRPENVSQVLSFLGLVNYYNRFLPNAASVLYPLHVLLQKSHKD